MLKRDFESMLASIEEPPSRRADRKQLAQPALDARSRRPPGLLVVGVGAAEEEYAGS
jgi:hypothetical protein